MNNQEEQIGLINNTHFLTIRLTKTFKVQNKKILLSISLFVMESYCYFSQISVDGKWIFLRICFSFNASHFEELGNSFDSPDKS